MSAESNDPKLALAFALAERIATIDLTRAAEIYPSAEALADRMIEALPDEYIDEPLLGPCFSTAALARWKQITRQAVTRQREIGTLFAVEHKGKFHFPTTQFDRRGRQTAAFRTLWTQFKATGGDPLAFAVWLQTPDPETGTAPAVALSKAGAERSDQMFLEDFTIIDPPTRSSDEPPDADR